MVIAPLIVLGLMFQRRSIWGNAAFILLFTIVFSALLKTIFRVPLNPALGIEGFSFPSGHMQAAVAFYGWLFLSYPQRLIRGALLVILGGIGWALIHKGYHVFLDVAGAVAFGSLTIYAFRKITPLPFFQRNPARLGFCLLPLIGVMMAILSYRTGIPKHTWKVPCILSGFSLSWFLFHHHKISLLKNGDPN
jgi:membrane-associated phospholipid phosphatase